MNIKKFGAVLALVTGAFFANNANAGLIQNSFNIELVADNDFAVFAGTSNSITSILYQNNVVWNDQVANIQSLSFTLGQGNDTFYVLAMGGGSVESLSGRVNGVNITDAAVGAEMSTNIVSSLSNYDFSAVANGTYDANLIDIQSALVSATWGSPSVTTNQVVVNESGFGSGFVFDANSAHLFRFGAADVNVPVVGVSEPSMLAVLGLGLLALVRRSRTIK